MDHALTMRKLGLVAAAAALSLGIAACAPLNQDKAQSAYAAGRYDEAANDIQAALASDPDNLQLKELAAKIFTQRGFGYYKNGEMLAASADFHRAVDYYPTYAAAWDYLGMIAFQQHNWQNAINYGSKAAGLEGKPDPGYVQSARENLRRVQSGGVRPYRAPAPPARQTSPAY
jgi:tetratricopeptide (TPR) repeat protein